jgi:soluble lytic murein transglycosylase
VATEAGVTAAGKGSLGGLERGLVVALTLAGGCRGQGAEPRLEPRAAEAQAVPDAGKTSFTLPAMVPVLDDARLAQARVLALARDPSSAARALDDARRPPTLSSAEDCGWSYVSGRLHLAANDLAEAATAFDRVAGLTMPKEECPLAAYAALRAAQAYAKLGRWEEAEQRVGNVGSDLPVRDEAELVLADALFAKGDRAGAVRLWRGLAASPRGPWVDVAVKLAVALLDGVEGDPAAHASEALDLATRVVVEAPKIAETSGAELARTRAIALVHPKDRTDALSDADRAKQARAWLDVGEPTKALAVANTLLSSMTKAHADRALACGVSVTRAQAIARVPHGIAADAWGEAIRACAGDEALVNALYSGGKASVNAKRLDEATERFTKVERLFPSHRFADDARLQGALVALQQGDEGRFTSMLLALPDDYPEGDMRGEALFRVALLRMTKGDWNGAKANLDRILALFPHDRHWATEGRAAYFRARAAAATGDASEARERYTRILTECPLAFYMTQAYARLAQTDPGLPRHVLDEAVAREEPGSLLTHAHPEFETPGFVRVLRLLEVGDADAARREVAALGLTGEHAESEVLWALGQLYDRAAMPELGHAFARSRVTDHLDHYPAGRWRAMWEVAFPPAYQPLVVRESTTHAIPAALTWAIMREESDFYADAKSSANAFGLMQLIVPTARGVANGTGLGWDEEALKRPEVSIALGTKFLAGLRGSFAGNRALAIAAYNGGAGAVNRWLAAHGNDDFDLWVEEIPWDETRGYIKRVLASMAAYAFLYDRPSLDEVLAIPARPGPRVADTGAAD